MKICGIICEYNPLHNGHAYLIARAREESGCDAVVCVMSGNFTQRGEPACLEKHLRAVHAVRAGADAVIELPAVFALAPAELFAKGAVRLLGHIPAFCALAFGSECADKARFLAAADAANESVPFREKLRVHLKLGKSLTRARSDAMQELGRQEEAAFLREPNNILGAEYAKAMRLFAPAADILPVLRTGSAHADGQLYKNYSSATAIRGALAEGNLRGARRNVPPFVAEDLGAAVSPDTFRKLAVYALQRSESAQIGAVTDCSEGLQNRLKALAHSTADYEEIVEKATSRRYISARIRRILAANALGIRGELVRKALRSPLYLRVLAVRKEGADGLLAALGASPDPLLMRRGDYARLGKTAAECCAADRLADDVFALCAGRTENARPRFV